MPYHSNTNPPDHETDYPIIRICMHRGMALSERVGLATDLAVDGELLPLPLQQTNHDRVSTKSIMRTSKSTPS